MTFVEDSQREPLSSTFSMPQSHVSEHKSIYLHLSHRSRVGHGLDPTVYWIGLVQVNDCDPFSLVIIAA